MQIPSSPNSSDILIRPEVLGMNNGFFFALLLHHFHIYDGNRGKCKGTGTAEKWKVSFIQKKKPQSVLFVSTRRESSVCFLSPHVQAALGSSRAISEPLSEALHTRLPLVPSYWLLQLSFFLDTPKEAQFSEAWAWSFMILEPELHPRCLKMVTKWMKLPSPCKQDLLRNVVSGLLCQLLTIYSFQQVSKWC